MPLYIIPMQEGGNMFMHGDLGKHCADCSRPSDNLCDYPIGGGKTCDRAICDHHSHVVGDDMHYCETHYREWRENNPDRPDYQLTRYRLLTLPPFAAVAMQWLKRDVDRLAEQFPEVPQERLRHSAANPLGSGEDPAKKHPSPDPRINLEQGLAWLIHAGLVIGQSRKKHSDKMPRWVFMLTEDGLRVANGETVEAKKEKS